MLACGSTSAQSDACMTHSWHAATGQDISTWHDIPLYLENGLLSFICEIPKETSAKMEVATVSSPLRHERLIVFLCRIFFFLIRFKA